MTFIKFLWFTKNQETYEEGLLRLLNEYDDDIQEECGLLWNANDIDIESFQWPGNKVAMTRTLWFGNYNIKTDLGLLSGSPAEQTAISSYLLKKLSLWLESKSVKVGVVTSDHCTSYKKLLSIYIDTPEDFQTSVAMLNILNDINNDIVTVQEENIFF